MITLGGDPSAVDSSSTYICFDCETPFYQPQSEAYNNLVEELCMWFSNQRSRHEFGKHIPKLEIIVQKDLFGDIETHDWTDTNGEDIDPRTVVETIQYI